MTQTTDVCLFVCESGSDWYRQPGTKDYPLASIGEAYRRLPKTWSGKVRICILRRQRHHRRAELARRQANAARRRR